MGGPLRFKTQLTQTGKTTTGIVVPPEVITKLAAGARPAVSVLVNGYSYRTTVGVMNGQSLLPFSSQHRDASGIQGGDAIDVVLALDTAPRDIECPDDLLQALKASSGVYAAFLRLASSRRKADIQAVLDAKAPETRARRIAAIVTKLQA